MESNAIETLKNSPMYNMSLSSLENFYTNFLEWLGNNYKKELFTSFLNKNIENYDNITFTKQDRHTLSESKKSYYIDLKINYNNEPIAIIECKLKSYPTREQLENYQKLFPNVQKFILFSFTPVTEDKLPQNWDVIYYKDFAEKLRNIFNQNYIYKNEYHKYLIQDYINVITKISECFPQNNVTKVEDKKYDLYKETMLNEINLEDIYKKYRASELTNYLQKEIGNVWSSFNNKKATIQTNFKENNDFFLGIQIEGNQYRYYICFNTQNKSQEELVSFARKILDENFWFKKDNTKAPNNHARFNEDGFCSYCTDEYMFLYRYQDMSKIFNKPIEEIKYKEILNPLNEDKKHLEDNWHKINEIWNNFIQK